MRKYLFYIMLFALASCSSEKPDNIEPTLRTLEATDITRTSAVLHGSVGLQGRTAMPSLVFKYGKDNLSMTVNAADDAVKTEDGYVRATASGLKAGTTYQCQLQTTSGPASLYGNIVSFTTQPNALPTIGDGKVLSHGPVSAIVGFNIPDDGGEALTEAGCYVIEGTVQAIGDKANAERFKAKEISAQDMPWRAVITGLKMNTAYTFFPYAVSSIGEVTGSNINFTTGSAYVVSEPGDLASLVSGNDIGSTISITGSLNGDDIACLRSLSLRSINMTDAHIVSGGGPYSESYYTENNVIGQQFFGGCKTLESISLPDDATEIAQNAFKDCAALKEITIPSSASIVNTSSGCTALQSIDVAAANTSFRSIDGVLTDAAVTKIVWFPMGKTGNYALPATINSIGDYAFRGCSIARFTLPDNITTMGSGAFYGSKVEEVSLSNRLTIVPAATFQQCKSLRTVRLGSATELISDYVFDGCPIANLYVSATTPPVCNSHAFTTTGSDFTKTCTLHVPKGCARYYRASRYWSVFTHIEEQ